jgi:hypothetical protein
MVITHEQRVLTEVLGPEAIDAGSSLKLVLDEEEVTVEWIPGSDGDGEGRRWPVTVSRGERPGAEQSRVRCACEGRKVEEELLMCPCARIRPRTHVGRHSPAATGTGATTARWTWSSVMTGQMVCVGRTG